MGCGSSQAVSVINVRSVETKNQDTRITNEKKVVKEVEVEKPVEPKRIPSSLIPLPIKPKVNSATDSGISSKYGNNNDDDDDDDVVDNNSDNEVKRRDSFESDVEYEDKEYRSIITEKSNIDLVQKIEKNFIEREGLNLVVSGKVCPPLLSKKEKETIQLNEEKVINDMLKKNGLVQKPLIVKENNAYFEIVEEDKYFTRNASMLTLKSNSESVSSAKKLNPNRFIKSEKNRPVLTADQIQEKLEEANRRRMEQNKLKIKPLASSITIEKSQNSYKPTQNQQFDSELIERQRKLREIRDKLKEKNGQMATPRTPRSKELVTELENFRPKTATNFRPEFS